MQKIFVSCSNEHLGSKLAVISQLTALDINYIEGQPGELSMAFYNQYRLCRRPLQKYSSSAAFEIRQMSEELTDGTWDLVVHAMGEHNFKVDKLLEARAIVQPGVVLTSKENCWEELLNGCFISTVSDYFLITTYPRMLDAIQDKAWEALKREPKDMTSALEAGFYTEENFVHNSDMQMELTNGSVVYID